MAEEGEIIWGRATGGHSEMMSPTYKTVREGGSRQRSQMAFATESKPGQHDLWVWRSAANNVWSRQSKGCETENTSREIPHLPDDMPCL